MHEPALSAGQRHAPELRSSGVAEAIAGTQPRGVEQRGVVVPYRSHPMEGAAEITACEAAAPEAP